MAGTELLRSDVASPSVRKFFERVSVHKFQPTTGGFTKDWDLKKAGVASLDDLDGKVRTLAVRDLVKAGTPAIPAVKDALDHEIPHVRHIAAIGKLPSA